MSYYKKRNYCYQYPQGTAFKNARKNIGTAGSPPIDRALTINVRIAIPNPSMIPTVQVIIFFAIYLSSKLFYFFASV